MNNCEHCAGWLQQVNEMNKELEAKDKVIAGLKEASELMDGLAMILSLIIKDLPSNRDWLNPEYESIAKYHLSEVKVLQGRGEL